MRNPEDLLAAVFAALNTEDWHALTTLCDPLGLAVFKRHTLRALSRCAEEYDTGDEFSDEFGDEEVHLINIIRLNSPALNPSGLEDRSDQAPSLRIKLARSHVH